MDNEKITAQKSLIKQTFNTVESAMGTTGKLTPQALEFEAAVLDILLSQSGKQKIEFNLYASLIVCLWYLSHHHSLYPHRMEVINDLKKKVPNLYFKGSLKQRFVSFCYTYFPDIYIRIRYLLATKKYK